MEIPTRLMDEKLRNSISFPEQRRGVGDAMNGDGRN